MNYQKLYSISWTQPYLTWPKPQSKPMLEPEVEDLTLAREVLAKIMSL